VSVPSVDSLRYYSTWSHAFRPLLCHGMHTSSTILNCVRPRGMCVTEPVSHAAAAAAVAAAAAAAAVAAAAAAAAAAR